MSRRPLRLAVLEAERVLAGAGVATPRVDAELLAAHVVGVPRGRLPMVPLAEKTRSAVRAAMVHAGLIN